MTANVSPPVYMVTVDVVILTVASERLQVLLPEPAAGVSRRGLSVLPGAAIAADEDLDQAASRRLTDIAGPTGGRAALRQLHASHTPGRGASPAAVSVGYLALVRDCAVPGAAGRWLDARTAAPSRLVAGHRWLLSAAVEQLQDLLSYTAIGTALCAPEFTMSDLLGVYAAVWDVALDRSNFARKVLSVPGFVVPAGAVAAQSRGRPAALYRAGSASRLNPAIQP